MANGSALLSLVQRGGEVNTSWKLGEGIRLTPAPAGPLTPTGVQMADPAVAARVIEEHAAARGLDPGRHAASLVLQRYCHRWCGIAVWCWAVGGIVLDVSADRATTRFEGGSPVAIHLDALRSVDGGTDVLLRLLLDDHLLPIARTFLGVAGLSLRNAEGNIAAAIAGGLRTASMSMPPSVVLGMAEDLMSRRRELDFAGTFRIVTEETESRLFYDRKTCCHWDQVPGGKLCSWCSKRTQDDRTQRFQEMLHTSCSIAKPTCSPRC